MENDVTAIPVKMRIVILISAIGLACFFLLSCHYEIVPYQPKKSNVSDLRSFIKKAIERQSPKYAYVPSKVEVTNEYIKVFHLETYSTGETREVPTGIYLEDIGDIKLLKSDIWWVEIYDKAGVYFYAVFTIKESRSKEFIDALHVLKDSKKIISSGSGLLISESGLVITAYHIVENAKNIEIAFPSKNIVKSAYLKTKDNSNDLAILKIINFNFSEISNQEIPYTLAYINKIKVGHEVFTLGFPLPASLGTKSRLSTGRINSLYGIEEDPRLFQIGNPVQPGNSGGPLFNSGGELVGVVVSGLNAKSFYENLGIIPQNVNFAIKINYLTGMLSALPESDEILNRQNKLSNLSINSQVEKLDPFIVMINSY